MVGGLYLYAKELISTYNLTHHDLVPLTLVHTYGVRGYMRTSLAPDMYLLSWLRVSLQPGLLYVLSCTAYEPNSCTVS